MPFIWIGESPPIRRKPQEIHSRRRIDPSTAVEKERPVGKNDDLEQSPEEQEPRRGLTRMRDAYEYADEQKRPKERQPAILAEQIMSTPVITVTAETLLTDVTHLMDKKSICHFPVVNQEGNLIGIITEHDIFRGKPNLLHRKSMPETSQTPTTVGDLMSTHILTATIKTTIKEIAKIMIDENIASIPILDDNHTLAGILTTTDVLKCVVNNAPLELWI